jgi:partner of Y14 and mago protein
MSGLGDTRVELADGNTIIPSTRRPDGTWRKEIRVRPGYVPMEEAGAYKAPAAARSSSGLPIGAAEPEPAAPVPRGRGSVHFVPGQLVRAIQQAAASHSAAGGVLPPVRPAPALGSPTSRTGTGGERLSESQKKSVARGEKRKEKREGEAADRLTARRAEAQAAVDARGVRDGPAATVGGPS